MPCSSIYDGLYPLDIGQPAPFGMVVGMADIASGTWTLSADFTDLGHFSKPLRNLIFVFRSSFIRRWSYITLRND